MIGLDSDTTLSNNRKLAGPNVTIMYSGSVPAEANLSSLAEKIEGSPMELDSWDVERGSDGNVLVRVHSCAGDGRELPDAVFTFRRGDPQYDFWHGKLTDAGSVEN